MSIPEDFPERTCRHLTQAEKINSGYIGRMRFHQSWFRYAVLGLQPGPNPHAAGKLYGNMLKTEDGAEGKNFLAAEIYEVAKQRFPPDRQIDDNGRLYNNLLGSQTMAFNLFGPLKRKPVATELFRKLPGFPENVTVTDVDFEYPLPSENPMNDHTAFDVFVRYERAGGSKGFVGIETKLTEPFSKQPYPFDRYAHWKEAGGWWWREGADEEFEKASYNQLWRNHLLAFAMLHQKTPNFDEGYIAVVHPLADKECVDAIAEYRRVLLPEGERTMLHWPLETIVGAWEEALRDDDELHKWIELFQLRYLQLEASEEAWRRFRGDNHG